MKLAFVKRVRFVFDISAAGESEAECDAWARAAAGGSEQAQMAPQFIGEGSQIRLRIPTGLGFVTLPAIAGLGMVGDSSATL